MDLLGNEPEDGNHQLDGFGVIPFLIPCISRTKRFPPTDRGGLGPSSVKRAPSQMGRETQRAQDGCPSLRLVIETAGVYWFSMESEPFFRETHLLVGRENGCPSSILQVRRLRGLEEPRFGAPNETHSLLVVRSHRPRECESWA